MFPENDPTVRDRIEGLRRAPREPDAQEFIRQELRRGTIRLTPGPDGDLTITPTPLWGLDADPTGACPTA